MIVSTIMPMLSALGSHLPVSLAAAENPLEHIQDNAIFQYGNFWLLSTNALACILTALIMLAIFPLLTRAYRRGEHVPTGTRNFFEAILVFVREDMVRPILGKDTDRYISYIWTLFFFILINNVLGLLPLSVLNLMAGGKHLFGGTATANIWVTGSLAFMALVVMQFSGIKANGFAKYVKHFMGGAPWYMGVIMIPVELLGVLVKPFALAIRLFANMTAGHLLLAVLLMFSGMAFGVGRGLGWGVSIAVVLGSVAIMFLEILAALIQAYIFAFLTTLFIGLLIVHEHEHGEGDEADAHQNTHHENRVGESLPDAARQAAVHMAG